MAELNINSTTTTDLSSSVKEYSPDSANLDIAQEGKETTWDYPYSSMYLGYYKTIPELKKAIDALTSWTVGKGFIANPMTEIRTRHITGWGKDNFQTILENMFVMMKVMGDSFAEVMRAESGTVINLKPISAEVMRIVVDSKGMIKRYEERVGNKWTKYKSEDILHLCNERIGGEIHGNSVIEACKWALDARNEAMRDHRQVIHRNLVPVRIIEIDSENTTKINKMKNEYAQAIKKGEVLIIPKGTVEIKDAVINIQDPITWIQYLENFIYIALGVPKIIMGGSEQFTEAGGKVGYLTFEQVYSTEQRKLEIQLKDQLGLDLTFNRPVSLKDKEQSDEAKNTSQVGFQPNDTQAGVGE